MIYRVSEDVYVFGGIKGLVRDGNELKKELMETRPEIILITISPEQVEGMKDFIKDPFEIDMSDYEIIYGINLSQYGEVMTPSPVYIEATKYAMENEVEMFGLDMDEDTYQNVYSRKVKTFDLLRHSLRKKKISRLKFNSETAEEFVEKWNDTVDIKSFKKVNAERIATMESQLDKYLDEYSGKKIICISDYDYYKELVAYLKKDD
ncbi:MAG: hypothetical protein QXZ44_06595 [Ferroplasma sp.]